MMLSATGPVDWILAVLLGLGWLALWATRRRVPPWFFVTAMLVAVVCFPAGVVAGRAETRGADCTPDSLCFSADEVCWWINGLLGVLTTGLLAAATLIVAAVRRTVGQRPR